MLRWVVACAHAILSVCALANILPAQDKAVEFAIPRCQVLPLDGHQFSLQIDGQEKTRWHFGSEYARPFFFPFNGPSGTSLTRMGHPGAPNHDHHQSIWFAHHKVSGIDFWGYSSKARIQQKQWLALVDGDDEAVMAVQTGWFDPDGRELLEQEMVAALRPLPRDEHALEIQFTLKVSSGQQTVELEQTNFGFLAVRVAKTLSAVFGGGELTNSDGQVGETDIFGKSAKWMDYSGPVIVGTGADRSVETEGITYFDHPQNPGYPTHWHVRQDGWMGAAFNLQHGLTMTAEQPLTLRYLLHAHHGAYDPQRAAVVEDGFRQRPAFVVTKGTQAHHQFEVRRGSEP